MLLDCGCTVFDYDRTALDCDRRVFDYDRTALDCDRRVFDYDRRVFDFDCMLHDLDHMATNLDQVIQLDQLALPLHHSRILTSSLVSCVCSVSKGVHYSNSDIFH